MSARTDIYRDLIKEVEELKSDVRKAYLVGHADGEAELKKEIKKLYEKINTLSKAAQKLVDECEAEFTLDGYWSDPGQQVSQKTVQEMKTAIAESTNERII